MSTDTQAELARLRAMLAARQGKEGFAANCAAIQARIAELEKIANGS